MRFLHNLPLKRKLTIISLVTSGVALLLACAAFIGYEQVSFRREQTRELDIAAHIIGANSASSLSFDDNDSAALTLKSLEQQPRIVRACLYDKDGHVFATYQRDPWAKASWPAPRPDAVEIDSDSLDLFHAVSSGGDTIGTIYLESDLDELNARRWRYLGIAASVFLAAILVTWLVASRLQRLISEPISRLAAVAGRVGAEKAYSIRATKHGDDEIGRLIDGFNDMLAQIEIRDAELKATHRDLERRVEERTRSLETARQELLVEKMRFQFIFDHAPVGISLHSSTDNLSWSRLINDAHLSICGLTRADVAIDNNIFREITHPDDYVRQLPLQEKLKRGEITGFTLEKRYIRPDGKIVWVVFTSQRMDFPDGRIESMSTISDITALKQAELEAAQERERFKFIFESLPVGVSLYSRAPGAARGTFLINDAQLGIAGVTREQVAEDRDIFNRLTHPDDVRRQLPLREKLKTGELESYTIEKRYLRPDGRTVWVNFCTQRKSYPDGHAEVLSVAVDITGLKLAQEEAAREQARLKFIFDSVPVGISLYSGTKDNLRGSFLINDAHLAICGVTREGVAANQGVFRDITHPEDYARQKLLNDALEAGELARYSIEKRYLRPDGRIIWAVFSAQRIDYPDGRVETLGTVVDVTDLKLAQEEAAREQARLKFIFDSVPVGISLYSGTKDKHRGSALINDAHLQICGVTREQLAENEDIFNRITHPEDRIRQIPLNVALNSGELPRYTIEKRYLRPDGRMVWATFSAQRITYPDGRIETLGTVVDITELKLAQEESARERERFKFIFESVPVGISLGSQANDGARSYLINDAHLRICGVGREQAIATGGDAIRDITHPEDLRRQAPLDHALNAQEISHFSLEKRYLRPDGTLAWVVISKQRAVYPDGRVEMLATVVDITELKLAQEAAAREQARLKFIFDYIPVGIALETRAPDHSSRAFLINDAHLRICGIDREQASGDDEIFSRITHPDDRARQAPLNAALEAGDIPGFSIEKRYIRPDGRVVWVAVSAQRIVYPDGRVETLGTVTDITDLKLAQQEAARERQRFKFIFESLPVGVSWRLIGPETLLLNPAHEKITGVTPEVAASDPGAFARATHPDDLARQVVLAEQLKNREIDHFVIEKRYIHPDGKIVWAVLMSRLSTDPETGYTQSVTTLVDITELKLAQEEVARERARFKFIFDALPVGVAWMVRGRPETRVVNPSFVRVTGVPAEQCQDIDRYMAVTHPDDRPAQEAFKQKLSDGEIDQYTLEKRYLHPDASVRWASLNVRVVRDLGVDGAQELATVVDITERKKAEGELEELHKQLLRTSHQAGMAEVATGVLHNVGNVLNSVNVSATVVSDLVRRSKSPNVGKLSELLNQNRADLGRFMSEDPKGKVIPTYLGTLAEALSLEQKAILTEIESLHKNIGHIKDIVAMQQSYAKTSGIVETVSVPDLVEDALRMNAGSLARHDVEVGREYDARPVITVEKNKVLQILVNLIRNAKYACDESGRTDKRLVVRSRADGSGVEISVIDNGVGIPAENLTRIFAHGFTTRKHGHGFGLHSGALAAKEMGGSLFAHSEGPGRGSTFTLRLPFAPAERKG